MRRRRELAVPLGLPDRQPGEGQGPEPVAPGADLAQDGGWRRVGQPVVEREDRGAEPDDVVFVDVRALRDVVAAQLATTAADTAAREMCKRKDVPLSFPPPRGSGKPGRSPEAPRTPRTDTRATGDVAPVPAQRDAPDERRRRSCAQAMPHLRQCAKLPEAYIFNNRHAALRAMKRATGNPSLALRNRARTTRPPCVQQGWHYNVLDGGVRVGSLTSCSCCVETAAGAREEERWRIVW